MTTPGSPGQVGTSGRVFTRTGRRFFWLADTAWAMFRRTEAQIDTYLDTRAAQGFTVIQAVMMFPQAGGPTNVYGTAPYSGGSISNRNDSYWDHVDYFVNACAARGLVAALHPLWADGQQGTVVTASNAYSYGQFLGTRYGAADNITWTFGGDYPPTGQTTMWGNLADGIRSTGDTHLITYHPQGDQTSVQWFDTTTWIDFQAMQGGHCINYSVDRNLVTQTHNNSGARPWIDAEPIYEQHPYCWVPSNGYATALDARRDAYWRVLGGAAGHTYGHHSVWQFYTGSGGTSSPIDTWTTALQAEAANDMQWVRKLFESRPRLEPANGRVSNPGTDAGWTPAAADTSNTTLVVYSAQGASRTVTKTGLAGATARPWWFNPRTGDTTQLADTSTSGTQTFTPPTSNTDWVLVVDSVDAGYAAPGTTVYGEDEEQPPPEGPMPQPGDVLGTSATLTWTPSTTGVYVIRYSATNSAGTGTDDITITVTPRSIFVDGARSATTTNRPQVAQRSGLTITGLRAATTGTGLQLTQQHPVTVTDARAATAAGQALLAQRTVLEVAAARAAAPVTVPLLEQHTVLEAYPARSLSYADNPALGLAIFNLRADTTAGRPTVTQHTTLTVGGARAATTSGAPLLAVHHTLTVHGARAASQAETPLLTAPLILTAWSARAGSSITAPLVGQHAPLTAVQDLTTTTAVTRLQVTAKQVLQPHDVRSQSPAGWPLLTHDSALQVWAARSLTRVTLPSLVPDPATEARNPTDVMVLPDIGVVRVELVSLPHTVLVDNNSKIHVFEARGTVLETF